MDSAQCGAFIETLEYNCLTCVASLLFQGKQGRLPGEVPEANGARVPDALGLDPEPRGHRPAGEVNKLSGAPWWIQGARALAHTS